MINIEVETQASGILRLLQVFDKNGRLKHEVKDVPNLLFNAAIASAYIPGISGSAQTYASTIESYEDVAGTWSQTGNTVTRSTGAGIFAASLTQVGNEIKWNTGERSHVLTRISDTQITVSGPARTITGGTIRRYLTNGQAWWGSVIQNETSGTTTSVLDHAAGWIEYSRTGIFPSAVSPYTLGSLIIDNARVKLPSTIAIDAEDQIQYTYARRETVTARNQSYNIGSESTGVPVKYGMTTIVGNGTTVDVTFSAATNFLAGDKLDLSLVVPKRVAVTSASSTSTTFTINATAHGHSVLDSIVHEGFALAGYNGTFVVATVPTADQYTITNAANPGASGAIGTTRKATPGTYFNGIGGGLATIASMVSSSIARITSAVTGPPVDAIPIGGDPGVVVRWRRSDASAFRVLAPSTGNVAFTEANVKALVDDSAQAGFASPTITSGIALNTGASTAAATSNDWTITSNCLWNAGAGKLATRVKQFALNWNTGGMWIQITLNTPFDKLITQRLKIFYSKQILRNLP